METEKTAAQIWDEIDAEESGATKAPEEPAEKPEPEQQPEEPPKEASPEPVTLTKEHLALLNQIPELTHLVKTTVGRVGSIQSELQKIGKAAAAGASDAPTAKQIEDASANLKTWNKLKEDFPDWAEGVEALVSARIPSPSPAPDITSVVTPVVEEAVRKAQLSILTALEPEWQSVAASQEFRAWLSSQPQEYQQRAVSTWEPHEVIQTIRDFRAASKPKSPPEAEKKKLAAAAIPKAAAKPSIRKPLDEMTPEELWAYYDEVDAKNRT